jgi:hypothetical protein
MLTDDDLQATKYLDQSTLFAEDVADSMNRLEHVMTILNYYIETFDMFRSNLDNYFKSAADMLSWNFDDELVLGRIMHFQERLEQIKVRKFLCKISSWTINFQLG